MFKKKQDGNVSEQPRLKKRKRWPWIVALLVVIGILAVGLPQVLNSAPVSPVVEGTKVAAGPIVYKISTRGDVQSKYVFDVVPKVAGRVSVVHVKEGDTVVKGQALVTLEVSDIEDQYDDLALELKIANATLAQIEVPSEKGQIASKEALEAQLAHAQREYKSALALFQEGSYTETQVSQAELAVKNANQALANQNTTNVAKKAESERDLQRLRIDSIQVKLARLKDKIQESITVAPADGTVSKVFVKEFDVASGQTPVVSLVDVNHLQIATNINQYDIHKIQIGQAVNVTADGLKDQVFKAKIASIAPVAQKTVVGQSQETVVPVLIDLDNKSGAFKPNYTAKIEIVIAQKDSATIIPYEATRLSKDRVRTAFVIQEGKLVEKTVKVGIEGELFIEVADDSIKVGDYVLLNPDETHTDGMAVTFTPKTDEVKP